MTGTGPLKYAALAAVVACLLLAAGPARACPVLEKAEPRVGATVAASPAAVTLHFSGPVELANSVLEVRDARGVTVSRGPLRHGRDDRSVGTGLRPDLPPGRYIVRWAIRCHCDEDAMTAIPGHYPFTVKP